MNIEEYELPLFNPSRIEKDKKKFAEDLKLVYKADTKELAETNLLELEGK